ncbi:MAG: 4'-phosphopantetheinyl transferase superfamily protein [Candidatus Levybacteria bacterium]|nr:4'-phosphopantetheinyl transferase superfamily protein [Candidatus Levybacteria bacterium]
MTTENMLGIDLVYLPEFKEKLKNLSLEKVFLPHELSQNKSQESLAGIFAVKEAFFKAIGVKKNWLDVWIEKTKEGKPFVKSVLIQNQKAEVSISHAGDYAIAIVMIEDER